MSEPAWVGAGRGDVVGTATIATDGTFTITAHGLDEGTPVEVDALSGGATSILRTDTTYFAINIAADTFQLVSVRGDELITFGSTGGADVFTRVPHMLAIQLRRLDSGLLFNDTDDGFGAREGIHPACEPAVTVAGTTWTVHDIVGVVFPRQTATSGPYRFAHPEESGALAPADGAQDRLDALYLQMQDDDEDNLGFRRAHVVYATGPADGSLSLPDQESEAPGSLLLTRGGIRVFAGGTPSPSVQAPGALFTVAAGGAVPVEDESDLPSDPHEGMLAWRRDTKELVAHRADADAWVPPVRGWQPITAGVISVNTVVDLTDGGRFPAGTFSQIRLTFDGNMNSDSADLLLRVNADGSAGLHQNGMVTRGYTDWADPEAAIYHNSGTTLWRVAQWHTTDCTAVVTIFGTAASRHCPFRGWGARLSGTSGSHRESVSSGRLTANRLIDSIEVRGDINSLLFWAEGYRS